MFAERLVKLLNLSASDNDNEALSAIRLANQLVRKNGLTWQSIVEDPEPQQPQYYEPPRPQVNYDKGDLLRKINAIRLMISPGFDTTFIDDINMKIGRMQRLTERQLCALENIYYKVCKRGEG